jgi:hypothetical protein
MAPQWHTLQHAYGLASDIPELLGRAKTDHRPGHESNTTWFKLWSALCHQGDAYSASYAAVPVLVRLAEAPDYRSQYDPLLLAACIELARLEGTGPDLPNELVVSYRAALKRGLELATEALENQALDHDSIRAYRGCVAAFHGQSLAARNILDEESLERTRER